MNKLVNKEQVLKFLHNTDSSEITKVVALYIADHPKIEFENAIGEVFKEMGILNVIDSSEIFNWVEKAFKDHPFYSRRNPINYSLDDIVYTYIKAIIIQLEGKELPKI